MDVEDRRRYFIVGSVILEIVQPLFRTKLENDYTSRGLGSFQDFLNTQPVIHILFHLRHRNATCCKNKPNCINSSKLPLIYCQWNLLYTENPGQHGHNCHCKFTANPVQLNALDITLAGLILLNCCNLGSTEENAIRILRRYKNDYLSHNTEGKITETEYKSLWTDLTSFVLQLDSNKQNDLIRIENRPLDEGLCSKYSIDLLNIHKKLNEMDTSIQGISSTVQGIDSSIQELLSYNRNEAICQYCKKKLNEQGMDERKRIPYKLGQNIFYLRHQIDLSLELDGSMRGTIPDVVMMDDGRLVICDICECRLLICNTDGSQEDIIPVEDRPFYVAAVNNSTVAVAVYKTITCQCIQMYDINQKEKLKSISVPGMMFYCGISMINNKLVVGGFSGLLIVDHQKEKTIETIETDCIPDMIHTSGHRIFYRICGLAEYNNIYWYSFTDGKIQTLTLPSTPCSITTLQDGSLYVLCTDDSVQHVSSNGEQFKTLNRNQSQFFIECSSIQYNSKQNKLLTCNGHTRNVKIFQEK
ncbi:uncharacterized protein LOC127715643 [Mytilus californianus]|uniref:uncharacterized protein LOC127715643 n=1 Tax=Mytilus californianus TaxID=6549 RepID=UPI0022471FC2|nr:uncharacterized protein LOC127715643 [Mytilus californianus]